LSEKEETKIYVGFRDGNDNLVVKVREEVGEGKWHETPLDMRLDISNHSPTGFECGYIGSGPAQLALALLCDATDERFARLHSNRYMHAVVGSLPQKGDWHISRDHVRDSVFWAVWTPLTTYRVEVAVRATYDIQARSMNDALFLAQEHIYTDCDPLDAIRFDSGQGVTIEEITHQEDEE
jgi:hypothetical protein